MAPILKQDEFPTNRTFDIVPYVHHRNFPQGLRTFGVFQPEGPEHKLISRDIILPPRKVVLYKSTGT